MDIKVYSYVHHVLVHEALVWHTHRYTREILVLAPFWSRHGLKLGVLFFFSHNQNNRGSSGAYFTCIYCSLSVNMNMCWNTAQRTEIVDAFVFAHVVGKNLNTPNLNPWLTMPLQRGVYQVWDLPCIFVDTPHNMLSDWSHKKMVA